MDTKLVRYLCSSEQAPRIWGSKLFLKRPFNNRLTIKPVRRRQSTLSCSRKVSQSKGIFVWKYKEITFILCTLKSPSEGWGLWFGCRLFFKLSGFTDWRTGGFASPRVPPAGSAPTWIRLLCDYRISRRASSCWSFAVEPPPTTAGRILLTVASASSRFVVFWGLDCRRGGIYLHHFGWATVQLQERDFDFHCL